MTRAEVLQIHRLLSVGHSISSISRETGRTRNTIAAHLQGRHDYDEELRQKVARIMAHSSRTIDAPDRVPGWLTLDEASYLIPWRPCRKWIYDQYVRRGMLRTEKVRAESQGSVRIVTCTQPRWVAQFVKKAMGRNVRAGVGIRRRHARYLLAGEVPEAFDRELAPGFRLACFCQPMVMLWEVRKAAQATGARFRDCAPVLSAFASLGEHNFALVMPDDLPSHGLAHSA